MIIAARELSKQVVRATGFAHLSLRAKLVVMCSGLVLVLSAVLFVELPRAIEAQSLEWVRSRSLGLGRLLASAVEASVDFDDKAAALEALNGLHSNKGAEYAVLLRADGSVFAQWLSSGVEVRAPAGDGEAAAIVDGLLRVRTPVRTRSGRTAQLLLGFGLEELDARRRDARLSVLRASALFLLAGLVAAMVIGTILARPVQRITAVAQQIAGGEAASVDQLPTDRHDELGRLAQVFVQMLERLYAQQQQIQVMNADLAARVQERTHELTRTHTAMAELKRTQEQLIMADRRVSVGRLAAGVAHEINNPLSFLSGNLEFLAHEAPEIRERLRKGGPKAAEEASEMLAELAGAIADSRQGAQRVVQIVRGLKTFARDDEDRRERILLSTSVDAAIEMALNEIKHRARLVRRFEPAPWVIANEVRLCQVFLNLLINAAQAIPDGAHERHEIRVSIGTDPTGCAFAEVTDTGSGIPLEIRGRIFDAFFTTKPVGIGSGLGLSISRNIVESFGGTITVQSEVGRGTTFRVVLPAAPPDAGAEHPMAAEAAQAQRPRPPGQRIRLLVVDDEPLVALTVRRLLAREADVVAASSAGQALALLARGERFDRILCDLMMPEMSGPELQTELARIAPETAARLVFMTGGTFSDGTRSFVEAWPNPILQKPFDGDSLWEALHEPIS